MVSTGFAVIDVDDELADPKYIYYFLAQNEITTYLQKIGEDSVSTYPAIKPSDLEHLEILIPDKTSQRRVSKILSNIDKKIEVNNKIIENLEAQAQAIFKSWFVDFEPFADGDFVESDLGLIPRGWEVKELDQIYNRVNGFSYTSKDLSEQSDINMVTIKDFNRDGGMPNDVSKPILLSDKIKERHFLEENDLLMSCTDLTQKAEIIGGVILYYPKKKFKKRNIFNGFDKSKSIEN